MTVDHRQISTKTLSSSRLRGFFITHASLQPIHMSLLVPINSSHKFLSFYTAKLKIRHLLDKMRGGKVIVKLKKYSTLLSKMI